MRHVKITMTLLVRNEEDIIEQNIRYHHSQGVDNFIVMDNRSTDNTACIIKSLSREIDIDYIYQPQDDYSQAEWVTEMARSAYLKHKADWVINNDADEFWRAEGGTLRDFIGSTPTDVGVLNVRRHNAVLCWNGGDQLQLTIHPERSEIFERLSVNNLGLPLPGKCIHRGSESVSVAQGNHSVAGVGGEVIDTDRGAYILHYPYRSLDHYKQKIRLGGAAYNRNANLPASMGSTWREHYKLLETDLIDVFWRQLSRPRSEIIVGTLQGDLFQDRGVVEYLAEQRRRQDEERLRKAVEKLTAKTAVLVDGFVRSQSQLLLQFAEEDRKKRPLYYNLQYCINGPLRHLERVSALQAPETQRDLCKQFSMLRDAFSLFPQNESFLEFLGELLSISNSCSVENLQSDCNNRPVILHVTCAPRLHLAEKSVASFSRANKQYHHIIVVGSRASITEDNLGLSFNYDGKTLTLPVPDDYESLHRKIFYALTVLHLVTNVSCVVKVDDNIVLQDAGRFDDLLAPVISGEVEYAGRMVGSDYHQSQWHGWHISKCGDPSIEERGYQYPLPKQYAAGGYGYVLGSAGIAACAYMYLAMKEFFSMKSVGLEDAYVGHAMDAKGIRIYNVASEINLLALPGLASSEAILT